MNVFYWIIDLLIPSTMIVIGLVFRKWIPKQINYIIGYRSKRSISSKDAWEYANRRFPTMWFKIGCYMFPLVVLFKLLFSFDAEFMSIIIATIGIVAVIITILIVEKELKQKFESKIEL